MKKEFEIKYLYYNKIFNANIALQTEADGTISLVYADKHNDIFKFNDNHLFTAFCSLRKVLSEKGKTLLCKGCRIDVHPTGSQLKWIYAYLLTIGERIDPSKNKVVIFDEELAVNKLVSVEMQQRFYEGWLDSIIHQQG